MISDAFHSPKVDKTQRRQLFSLLLDFSVFPEANVVNCCLDGLFFIDGCKQKF